MSNKNVTAAFITYCIALVISWFIWGHTTNHIWSAWLFLVLLLAGIIVFILMIIGSLQDNTFDSNLLFAIAGVVFFDLFMLGSVGDIGLTVLKILAYIFSALLLLLLIFTAVRYFLHQTS